MIYQRKITLITNIALALIFTAVFAASMYASPLAPSYGGKNVGAVYNGNRANPNVSLMFNVYENTEVVEGIVETLAAFKVKATFFVGGCWADDNQSALNIILENGNEIGSHGYFHRDHAKLNYKENYEEIEASGKVIEAVCGVKPTLFAPPSGSFNNDCLLSAFDLGYSVIMWSKDTIDWRDSEKSKIINRATRELKNGDLILMHPKPHTLKYLPEIIAAIMAQNYKIVTVSENMADNAA